MQIIEETTKGMDSVRLVKYGEGSAAYYTTEINDWLGREIAPWDSPQDAKNHFDAAVIAFLKK